jgi:hypothetical protein
MGVKLHKIFIFQWAQWLTLIILATWEAESGGLWIELREKTARSHLDRKKLGMWQYPKKKKSSHFTHIFID